MAKFNPSSCTIAIISEIGGTYDCVVAKFHETLKELYDPEILETLYTPVRAEGHTPDKRLLFRYEIATLPQGLDVFERVDSDIDQALGHCQRIRHAMKHRYNYTRERLKEKPHDEGYLRYFKEAEADLHSLHITQKHILPDLMERACRNQSLCEEYSYCARCEKGIKCLLHKRGEIHRELMELYHLIDGNTGELLKLPPNDVLEFLHYSRESRTRFSHHNRSLFQLGKSFSLGMNAIRNSIFK